MLAVSQSFGKIPELSEWVNITRNTGATCSAQVLRIHVGISSGPAALPGLDSLVELQFLYWCY